MGLTRDGMTGTEMLTVVGELRRFNYPVKSADYASAYVYAGTKPVAQLTFSDGVGSAHLLRVAEPLRASQRRVDIIIHYANTQVLDEKLE